MTRAIAKRKRRRRGRPPKHADDQIIIDMAAALMEVSTLGPQQARDFALALLEGHLTTPENLPRGHRRMPVPSILAARELPTAFKSREGNIADKIKRGVIKPRPDVVAGFVRLLRAKDKALIRAVIDLLPKKASVARKAHFSGGIEN
jgi:hypothetical protein